MGSADLDVGVTWVEDRIGVAPVSGGAHDGFGTRNALVALADVYLEVLALDPSQLGTSSPLSGQVRGLPAPTLLTGNL